MQKLTFPENTQFLVELNKILLLTQCFLHQHWNHIPGLLDSKVSNKEHLDDLKEIQNVELLWYGDYSTMHLFHPAPTELNP